MKRLLKVLLLLFISLLYIHATDTRMVTGVSELSNLHVNAFCQDSLGYMWIGTSRGLNKYNGYEYIHYFREEGNEQSLPHDYVNTLFSDSRNRLWVGTNAGIACYNDRMDIMTRCYIKGDKASRCVYDFAEDKKGRIWVCLMDGIGLISSSGEEGERVLDYKDTDAGLGLFKGIRIDKSGMLWVIMDRGLLKLNTTDKSYQVVRKYPGSQGRDIILEEDSLGLSVDKGLKNTISLHPELKFRTITCSYTDMSGNLWVGSFANGYTVFYKNSKRFNPDETLSELLRDRFVTSLSYGKNDDNLWIGTRYDGLFRYNRKTRQSVNYTLANSRLFVKSQSDLIQSLFADSHNRLWIGLTDGVCVLDLNKKENYPPYYLTGLGGVVSIAEDKDGKIWLGTASSGVFVYSDLNKEPQSVLAGYSKNATRVEALKSGKMLVSFFSDNVYIIDSETLERFPLWESKANAALSAVLRSCITISETSPNSIWLGSYSSGMANVNISTGETTVYDVNSGLPSNDVLGIVPDELSHLWLSTSFGLSRFDLNEKGFRNFFSFDGTKGNQFHEKACFKTPDRMIYMGGNHGLTFFNSGGIVLDTTKPRVILEYLKILNQDIKPSEAGTLKQSLPYTSSITLNHKQNVFTIDYSAIGFSGYQKYTYACKLEGLDKDWNEMGSYRRATYMNLKPGKYTFKVRVRNESGVWSEQYATLDILVKAAPWFTTGAYLIYFLLLAALVYTFFRLSVANKLSKMSLEMLKKDQRREQELTQMKISFFNNISHELQTPLSLIYGPLSVFLKNARTPAEQRLLSIMEMNVSRLMKLISQLLDFGKMESDTIELKVREQDAITLLQIIKRRFDYYAEQKQILFTFHTSVSCHIACFDEDKIDKIMNNLLSNAFKYTPQGKAVRIYTQILSAGEVRNQYAEAQSAEGSYLQISVSDEGPGIPENELPDLFGRYKRLNIKAGGKEAYQGTGLGLSYTKSLILLHKGFIKVKEGEERGMIFSFVLPLSKTIFAENEIIRTAVTPDEPVVIRPASNLDRKVPADNGVLDTEEKKYTLLLVDDDPGIQDFAGYLLQSRYSLLQAFDAEEGYRLLKEEMPDIVITDVLMPGMNGYDFCRKIKADPELSHIVVVILTAKGRLDEHLEGLAVGADAYVNKPFDSVYLLAILNNLIANRERLKGIFHTGTVPEDSTLSAMDKKFMEQLYRQLDEHLDEVEMNVNNLSRELGFSRSSFYRKIKALTGESPNSFIRIYRLNKAKTVLEKGEMTIGEVASYAGFSTLSHFSSCFKKQFGVSPTDYKNK